MIAKTNIDCFRGDNAVFPFTAPFDLTGAKVWMTARRGLGGTVVFQHTSEGAGITIDPDQEANPGDLSVRLDSSSTSSLASEEITLYYDVQVLTGGGDLKTIAYGDLTVTPDATVETE